MAIVEDKLYDIREASVASLLGRIVEMTQKVACCVCKQETIIENTKATLENVEEAIEKNGERLCKGKKSNCKGC